MPTTFVLSDRFRVERAVWTVDTHLASLPGGSRREIRREMRANLWAAAAEVGAPQAVRALGDLRVLAVGYLEAEYGEGRPRPSIRKAVFWSFAVGYLMVAGVIVSFESFMAGVEAGAAHPAGTYHWHGMRWLGFSGEVGYVEGQFQSMSVGFASWTPPLLITAAFLAGGRYWREVPMWWRRWRRTRPVPNAG